MDILKFLITASIGYLFYGVVISENLFHRLWSVAVLAFMVIAAALATLPLSLYTIPLSFAGLLTLGICLWLSPLHALFVPLRTINSGARFQIFLAGAAEKPADASAPLPLPSYYVDIVAVHGLASNPNTTWNSRTEKSAVDDSGVLIEFMWLRDSLVKEGLRPRTMIFRHDTIWEANAIRKSLHDHGNDLIRSLRHERGGIEDEKRPIIFIGHSFGGLIIKQALVNASLGPKDKSCRDIYQNTIGFIFMGTPHRGAHFTTLGKLTSLLSYWRGSSIDMLEVTSPRSSILKPLQEDFMSYIGQRDACGIENVAFVFEAVPESLLGIPTVPVVEEFSAVIDGSIKIGIEKRHREIQRFNSGRDPGYRDIVECMKTWVEKHQGDIDIQQSSENMLRPIMHEFDVKRFLGMLSVHRDVQPRVHSSPIDDPKFYWIFKNEDYEEWASSDAFSSLLITCPPRFDLHRISSYFVNVQRERVSKQHRIVLDFFFMDARDISERPFLHTLVYQFISQLPGDQKKPVSEVFLQTLLERGLRSDSTATTFKPGLSWEANIRRIMGAELPDLEIALANSISRAADVELSLVFVGMDGDDNISRAQTLASQLEERNVTFKALYLARSTYDVMIVKDGMRHIPYDCERKECLGSLRFSNKRYDLISREHEGSFEWLWRHPSYREWSGSTGSRLLFIEGKPGSGKSTLARYFKIHHLDYEATAKDAVVADFFYSNRGGVIETDHSSMLRSILFGILDRNETFFYHFQRSYREYRALPPDLEPRQREKHYYEFLKKVIASLKTHPHPEKIYLILDAIDESDATDRQSVIEMLSRWCRESQCCVVKIFVASRPVYELDKYGESTSHILLQDETREYIKNFTTSFLGSGLLRLTGSLLQEATEHVVREAHGVFLWLQLIREEMRPLAGRCRESEVFDKLKELPTGLTEFYEHILGRFMAAPPRDFKDGIRMLELALFAERNLSPEEYRDALAIPDDINTEFDPSYRAFKSHLLNGIDFHIVECARNYLEIKESQGARTVQIMHRTVYTFFQSEATSTTIEISPETANRNISVTCIRYLLVCAMHKAFRGELPDTTPWTSEWFKQYAKELNQRPLLSYVLDYAKSHIDATKSDPKITDIQSAVSRQISGAFLGHVLELWVNSPLRANPVDPSNKKQAKVSHVFRSRLLFAAISLGLVETVKTLLAAGTVITFHKQKKTPLAFAASLGHSNIMKLLLDREVDIKQRGDSEVGGSALLWAAFGGHEEATRLLLDYKADVHARDDTRQTALHKVASKGHKEVTQLLLDCKADVNAIDNKGQTALHKAASKGHEEVTQLLLDCKADVNALDDEWQAALHKAASEGHERIVRILITSNAEIDLKDGDGRTPMHVAAQARQAAVVQLLQDFQADMNKQDELGRTPLYNAVSEGGDAVTEILVGPSWKQGSRAATTATGLCGEADCGHERLLWLLRSQSVDLDKRNARGQTALHRAAADGQNRATSLLLAHGAKVDVVDRKSQTALHVAAQENQREVAELLLLHKILVDAEDAQGRTALQLASKEGHVDMVQLLLAHKANPEKQDRYGHTALHLAVKRKHGKVVQHLIDHRVEVLAGDRDGRTALHMSAATGCEDYVRLLLVGGGGGDANINVADGFGRTALHLAAEKGHDVSAKLLLDRQAEIDAKDRYGWTPLHVAAAGGNLTTAQLLRGRGADVDILNGDGQAPLYMAAGSGYAAVVNFLLDEWADPSIQDSYGQTALHIAASGGHIAVVEALIARAVDLGAEDRKGRTALQRAIEAEEVGVSVLLQDIPVS